MNDAPFFPALPEATFAGRTVLVTGGGTGLGLAVSLRFGRLGANVVCGSRDAGHHGDLVERARDEGFEVLSVPLDVREPAQAKAAVAAALERFGALDVLVNNAAGNFIRPSMTLSPRGFATVMDIVVNGTFNMSREAGLAMRDRGGAIVNVSAPYATTGMPGVVHSACAKAGVEAMTKTLAAEWARYGIRVNAISPGPFPSKGAAERLWPSDAMEEALRRQIPLGRFGTVEEVAELICLLASPAASWITGSVLLADGGWLLPKPFVEFGDEGVPRKRE